jgi:catechol 2,3-dioxygenase-like lactoylglutathione lyase family enzyme
MELGAFSISLSVKDIAVSRRFYEALGFAAFAGDQAQKWLIMRNGAAVVGLFEGMFEKNTLTFNPGWDQDTQTLPSFEDVRDIQHRLEVRGLVLTQKVDPASSGPGHLVVIDPDGNPILIDQHV